MENNRKSKVTLLVILSLLLVGGLTVFFSLNSYRSRAFSGNQCRLNTICVLGKEGQCGGSDKGKCMAMRSTSIDSKASGFGKCQCLTKEKKDFQGTFDLIPPSGPLKIGDLVTFTINLDTEGQTVYKTAVGLSYLADVLEYNNLIVGNSMTSVYFRDKESKGRLIIQGISKAGYKGKGIYARIVFKLISLNTSVAELATLFIPNEITPIPTQKAITPTTTPGDFRCQIKEFLLTEPCDRTGTNFRFASYNCAGFNEKIGSQTSCKPVNVWFSIVRSNCLLRCPAIYLTPTVTVVSTQTSTTNTAASRNTKRRIAVNAILNAINQYQADNKGVLPSSIPVSPANAAYIGSGGANLCGILVPKYLKMLPVDPLVPGASLLKADYCLGDNKNYNTVYSVIRNDESQVTVAAPWAELGETISVTR